MTTTAAPLRRPTAFVPFRTPVRGHAFAARPPQAASPAPGQRVALAREPHNPADPLAVGVWLDLDGVPWRIGYLAREVAARVAPRLDAGVEVEARVDGWMAEPERRWQRPVLAVFPLPESYDPASSTAHVVADDVAGPAVPAASAPVPRPARSIRRRLPGAQSR